MGQIPDWPNIEKVEIGILMLARKRLDSSHGVDKNGMVLHATKSADDIGQARQHLP
jgi:hypothetical protein